MHLEQALSRAQQSEEEKRLTMEKYKKLEVAAVHVLDVYAKPLLIVWESCVNAL